MKEPGSAPPAEQWFPLTLGSTLRDPSPSSRFYSLRYEFKPASIDTSRPGSLFKSTDNKVTVELCNNQAGRPKVSFQGNSEDCKELDAVIFFDGKSFRLERLHRAVKSLRHVRLPGESAASTNVNNIAGGTGSVAGSSVAEPVNSPGHQNGVGHVSAAAVNVEKINPLVQVEEITVGQTEASGDKKTNKRKADAPAAKAFKGRTPPQAESPLVGKVGEVQVEVETEIDERDRKATETPSQPDIKIDEEIVSDYEIEDVDVSEDEDGVNAAEALRAQAAVSRKQESSTAVDQGVMMKILQALGVTYNAYQKVLWSEDYAMIGLQSGFRGIVPLSFLGHILSFKSGFLVMDSTAVFVKLIGSKSGSLNLFGSWKTLIDCWLEAGTMIYNFSLYNSLAVVKWMS
ncbi:hypothetical protein GOP47_0001995 [Adiantum capillus-veneris]|uniref:Transcription elongation factor Eaf N-terminal domain-containing protein n=1 Tax=Adiantum capillus-veneris TaxID=13818 RepID=A0A9D4ZQP2_ADICA|nr:hypothetical protein GOP47_0001995 [Adiantum capillus-veneris]